MFKHATSGKQAFALLGCLWCVVGAPLAAQQAGPLSPEQARAIILSAGSSGSASRHFTVLVDCDSDRALGSERADELHGNGRLAGGIVAGVLLGLLGTGIAWGVAAGSNPQPKSVPASVTDESCYRDGYKSRARSKNKSNAAVGGLLGTLVWLVIYAAASST